MPIVRLAALADVPVLLHESSIRLRSALYGRDFAARNDILSKLDALSVFMLIGSESVQNSDARLLSLSWLYYTIQNVRCLIWHVTSTNFVARN